MESKNVGRGLDRISSLPDFILCSIISLLPVEEVVRTSILARRWRHVWKHVTCLDIDSSDIAKLSIEMLKPGHSLDYYEPAQSISATDLMSKQERATSLTTSILLSHRGKLTKCQIVHFPISSPKVKLWVDHLANEKGIQELSLACKGTGPFVGDKEPLDLPRHVFCNTLSVLNLTNYVLYEVSPFRGFNNLRTLKLNSIDIDDERLAALLDYCTSLRELSLCTCYEFEQLEIHNENLEFLELRSLSLRRINLHTKALNVFILSDVQCQVNCLYIEAPNALTLKGYCNIPSTEKSYIEVEEILARCGGILKRPDHDSGSSISTTTNYISPFEKLQVLSVSLDLNNMREVITFAYIFQTCSYLRELFICAPVKDEKFMNQCSSCSLSYPECMFWEKREPYDSISKSLRVLCIWGFRGKELEIEFVKFIIRNASKMERIVIQCNDNCTRDEKAAIQHLLSEPKASLDVSIILETGSSYSGRVSDHFDNWLSSLNLV